MRLDTPGTSADKVAFLLESRFIDERVAEAAMESISLRERVSQLGEEERRLIGEREQLLEDQERIRANVDSLAGVGRRPGRPSHGDP